MQRIIRGRRAYGRGDKRVVWHPGVERHNDEVEASPDGDKQCARNAPIPTSDERDAEEGGKIQSEWRARKRKVSKPAKTDRNEKNWPKLEVERREPAPVSPERDPGDDPCDYSTSQHERRG
jgi:hypothetical protein